MVVGEAAGVAVAVRLTRAVRLARISATTIGQLRWGSELPLIGSSGGSCARCTLDQSRATESRWLRVSVAEPQIPQFRWTMEFWLGTLRVAVAELDQSRSTRLNLRFYACCGPRNFVSSVDNGTSVLVSEAVGVAVAVRLTRAVRLARISRWLVSVVVSSVSVGLGTFVSVAVQQCGQSVDHACCSGRLSSGSCFWQFRREFRSWLAKRWELRSLCAWPEPCDSLESQDSTLVAVSGASSVAVDNGTSVVVGEAVGVAVAVRLTRAVRLARISRYACFRFRPETSSIAVGQ